MQRAMIVAGGLGCLLLAVLVAERPFAGAPAPTNPDGATLQLHPEQLTTVENPEPSLVKAVDSTEEPVSPKDAWLTTLMQMESEPIDQAAPVIARALQSPDREVRLRAVVLLAAAKDDPAILPLLGIAQSDADSEVRRDAIAALAYSGLKEGITPYLLRGASDMQPDVRDALIQTVWSLKPEQRDDFIAQSIYSGQPEIAAATFAMLAQEGSAQTVSLLLNVYATNDTARIEQANEVMSNLLGQTFDNAAQASSWWRDHQGDYNDDLSKKTEGL